MLKVKKETIVKSLFTTILAVGFASNVSARTNVSIKQDVSGKPSGDACNYPLVNEKMIVKGKCNSNRELYHVGGGELFQIKGLNDEIINGYCIDPEVTSPGKVNQYEPYQVEDITDSMSREFIQGASNICEKTKGNEQLRITALKAFSISSKTALGTPADAKKAYENYLNNSGVVFNPNYTKFTKQELDDALKSAASGVQKNELPVMKKSKKNTVVLETQIAGTLHVDADGYKVTVNGTQYSSDMKIEKGTYTIKIDENGCKDGNVNITFSYDETLISTNSSSTAKVYKLYESDGKMLTETQRILTCDDKSKSNCEDGICKINETLNAECTDEPVCDPNVVVHNQDEYCNKDGETIVSISTNGTNDLACAKDPKYGIKATPQLIGNNELCEVYCVEDYELSLPGPDATKGDPNVKITSGTFFTIDEKNMTGKTTVKCYNVLKPEALAEKINLARQGSVNKFNDNSLKNAYGAATCEKNSNDDGYSIKGGTYEFATLNASTGKIEVTKKSVNNGISYSSESKCNEEKAKIQNSLSGQSFSDDLINQYMKSYEECTNWDFTKAFKNSLECSADIKFEYYSGMDFNVDIEGKTSIGSSNIEKANKSEKIYTGVCTETSCGNANQQTSIASGVSVGTISANTEYTFDNYFVSNLETGELIKVKKNYTPGKNESAVVQGFPIDLKVPQGKYQYRYTYTGIGHDFDDNSGVCKTGRLDYLLTGDNNNFNCSIDVNGCNDCGFDCGPDGTGENCDMDQDDCVECRFDCVGVGCIMNGNSGFLATYRTLSLNDPSLLTPRAGVTPATLLAYNNNPSSTDDYDTVTNGNKTNWSTAKGKKAAGKITKDGEKIYDKDPEYSVTINAKSKKIIKDYNKEQKNYLSSKLNCELVEGSYGICESTLLDKLASDKNASIKGRNYGNEKDPYGNVKYPGTQDSFVGPAYK